MEEISPVLINANFKTGCPFVRPYEMQDFAACGEDDLIRSPEAHVREEILLCQVPCQVGDRKYASVEALFQVVQ